ncbi:hypothetical protein ACVWZZ_004172 [Bradyrhizobium sp. LM6.10]
MTKTLGYSLLAIFAAMSVAISAARPEWISDENPFLKNFVNHELLALLGVILAITLASIASVHLEFNKIEERYKRRFLAKSRTNLRKNAYWLISLFAVAVALVAVKPVLCGGAVAQALANMGGLLILLWHVLILITLTQLVFSIEPDLEPPAA